jgi:serine/threonine-protein kinase
VPVGPIAAIFAIAACAFVAALLILNSGGGGSGQSHTDAAAQKRKSDRRAARRAAASKQTTTQAQAQTPPATSTQEQQATGGSYSVPQPTGNDPGAGAKLQAQGHQLVDQGDANGAIPVLEKAIQQFPAGTSDLNYAYALFDLGHALRLAGRPDDAIPVLEKRLTIDNQRDVVQKELDAARADAQG